MSKFDARILDADEALAARHFCYDVYAGQLNWLPAEGNPSGWVVRQDAQGFYFEDMFNRTARWFGVFEAGSFACTGRVFTPADKGLELELYNTIPPQYKEEGRTRVELNRLTVDARYNGSPVIGLLLREMFSYVRESRIDYVFVAAPPASMPIVMDIGFSVVNTFKYAPEDEEYVSCTLFDTTDRVKLDEQIKILESKKYTLNFF
ncbi:MAG: hypothetical protein JW874_02625 [Spirochaetales bacterium]|nr:hypothetical protein [Spirochaetales bacterium]